LLTKTCCNCGREKPLSKFHKDASRPDRHTTQCKKCRNAHAQQYRARNPDKVRAAGRKYARENYEALKAAGLNGVLQRKYGITLAGYDAMLKAQGNRCAICDTTPEENGRRFDVDHDHETGDVRGLLCQACNRGIGQLADSAILLRRAADYLEETSC